MFETGGVPQLNKLTLLIYGLWFFFSNSMRHDIIIFGACAFEYKQLKLQQSPWGPTQVPDETPEEKLASQPACHAV